MDVNDLDIAVGIVRLDIIVRQLQINLDIRLPYNYSLNISLGHEIDVFFKRIQMLLTKYFICG